ncbi:MAG: CRISPR-associated endoribonuclease Cas6 [Cytophagales bacterium]|nr:CRISPR-associated endoribonuclease Cas6 [Cytophagales bacterium]
MRVRIIFSLKNRGAKIHFHHQHLLAKFAQNIISKCDPKYRDFKFYNFSGLKGQIKVGKGGLHYLSSKVTLVFSSLNIEFLNQFLNTLFSFKQLYIGEMELSPDSIEMEADINFDNKNKYVCISPVLIVDPVLYVEENKSFIEPYTDTFSDFLYESTMLRMEKSGNYSAEQISSFNQFQFTPDKEYLLKMQSEEKKYSRVYQTYINNEKYEVRGYTLPFTLFAAPDVHNFIFHSGLGALSENGFGMIDLANSDPTQRTIKYNLEKSEIKMIPSA